MKKIISITFLWTVLLILAVLPLIPHHHHRDAVCAVMELCQTDQTYNDRHTAHDSTGESESTECIAYTSYMPADEQTDVAIPDAQSALKAVSLTLPAPAVTQQQEYGIYIFTCTSAVPDSGGGLRAPPRLS